MLERQRASGLSVRRFCREEEVSEASFHSWKSKFACEKGRRNASSEEAGQKRAKAKRVMKQTDSAPVFIPVRVSPTTSGLLEVVHPRGCVVRVPAVFDEGALRQVLEVLDQGGGE
jgi:hypothetical protein